jgi:hypothetical protein
MQFDATKLGNVEQTGLTKRITSTATRQNQTTHEAMEPSAVVIPTLNEERSIGKVIDDVPVADLLKNGLKTAVCVIEERSTENARGGRRR